MSNPGRSTLSELEALDAERAARRFGIESRAVVSAVWRVLSVHYPDEVATAATPVPVDLTVGALMRQAGPRDTDDVPDPDPPVGVRLRERFARLLTVLADASDEATVRDINGLTDDDRHRILHEWNDTDRPDPDPVCLHELVERRAALSPRAPAVEQGTIRLDYATLDAEAERLAKRLRAGGLGRGDRVAVHMDRTPAAVVALLGVLKAGATYVPVDSHTPPARLAHILDVTRAAAAVVSPSLVEAVLEIGSEPNTLAGIIVVADRPAPLSEEWIERARRSGLRLVDLATPAASGLPAPPTGHDRATPDDTAYIIFTSGSTGVPKGVVVRHAPAVNVLRWVNRTMGVGERDRLLFVTAFAFDLSVYDIFGVLGAGGCVRVASAEEVREPQRLLEIMDTEAITIWDSAPAALQQLEPFFGSRQAGQDLRLVMLSGDWIPVTLPDSVRAAFPNAEVLALGGATEAAIWSNYFRVGTVSPDWTSIPYGRPIDNARYYVLDSWLRPVPPGAAGDLYIGGACLAEGYLEQPGLTAARFVGDPFAPVLGSRMYRTGDRARFFPDDTIEFLGRLDAQVKIRGYRVELGEIEATLGGRPDVGAAVAVVRGEGTGRHIVAYVVPATDRQPIDPAALSDFLATRLPDYMVPGHIVELSSLPVTANGKVDRAALPDPQPQATAYLSPRTSTEKLVADIWADVLDAPQVGANDDFFDRGGHSVLLPRVMAKVQKATGTRLSVRVLLSNPCLSDFAAAVDQAVGVAASDTGRATGEQAT